MEATIKKPAKRILGAQQPEVDADDNRVTLRINSDLLVEVADNMTSLSYGKKDRSKWISEAIVSLWEQFNKESEEDRALYLKLGDPIRGTTKTFDIYLSEEAMEPFAEMVRFTESIGITKNPKTRVAYLAMTMRLQRNGGQM